MAAVLETRESVEIPAGGGFLFAEVGTSPVMAPERFTEEQRLYYRTAQQFARERVLPKAAQIERKDNALLRQLLRDAGELGLLMIDIPEAYGGLGLDKTTSLLVAEAKSILGAWSSTFGAHTAIGTLPIVWFGSEQQKRKYLPKMATGEWVGAYALTETGSGSDALAAKTRAVLSPDGRHYLLTGAKQFITNAGFADVFVVFAKIDGAKFTAFIVERGTPGLSVGPEEHKMGIRGSSTCSLILENAVVPVENVLGEIGKGHKIAFNILNIGRLKLGSSVLGGMKYQLEHVLKYAQERKQFDAPIFSFGLIREKFARMATWTYAVESMAYRTSGLIDARLATEDGKAADYDRKTIAAIEEYAIEASILKVFGSEAVGMVVDEAVQIHGGYGFIEDFPVARAYRDARINRIFEGTNEINRLLITGMLLKRALARGLPLFDFAQAIESELSSQALPGTRGRDALAREALCAEYLKRLAVYPLKLAAEAFGTEIERRQPVLAWIADIVMDAFALDSMIARARQVATSGTLDPTAVAMIRLFAQDAQTRACDRARRVLCAVAKGADPTALLDRVAPLFFRAARDTLELEETIAQKVADEGGYPIRAT
jgi:alkylation response protein AidB-like acyl-CoA dehydrogenase